MRATIGSLAAAAAVIGTATASANAQQAVQWRVEDGGNGHWYQLSAVAANWHDAAAQGTDVGGHLTTLLSAAETAFAASVASGEDVAYIGGVQATGAAEPFAGWRWITDEPWGYTSWHFNMDDAPCGVNGGDGEQQFLWMHIAVRQWDDINDVELSGCPLEPRRGIIEWSADCNNDGIVDYGQILSGQLVDSNSNGVPDTCELGPCAGDVIPDGLINGVDLAAVLSAWGTTGQGQFSADANRDGIVDGIDLSYVLSGWGNCITVPTWATLLELEPDPAVVIDAALRSAITSTGLAWRVRDTATQIEMVLIPPGTFQMGCSASNQWGCDGDESPVHTVTLTNAFYMGRYEVTQAQWTARMGSNPSRFQSPSAPVPAEQVPNRPVERVSWNTIQGFLSDTGMRLPTEAEWEWAYRAGTATAFHSMPGYPNGTNNDSLLGAIAWFSSNSAGQTRPVGQKAGNGFGLHDMSGNLWEWVNDWYSSTYYASSPSVDPPGPSSGSFRVLRGGGWDYFSVNCRSSIRDYYDPSNDGNGFIGFRVARNPKSQNSIQAHAPPEGLLRRRLRPGKTSFLGAVRRDQLSALTQACPASESGSRRARRQTSWLTLQRVIHKDRADTYLVVEATA